MAKCTEQILPYAIEVEAERKVGSELPAAVVGQFVILSTAKDLALVVFSGRAEPRRDASRSLP